MCAICCLNHDGLACVFFHFGLSCSSYPQNVSVACTLLVKLNVLLSLRIHDCIGVFWRLWKAGKLKCSQ